MKSKVLLIILFSLVFPLFIIGFIQKHRQGKDISGAPPYGEPESAVPEETPFSWLADWERPEGPAKVAVQVGHWKNDEVPEELDRLRHNTGASAAGVHEVDINLTIAKLMAEMLTEQGILVEILPTTVPPDYWADVFVAIHADGSENSKVSGFKIAAPWRDFTGKSNSLVSLLESHYQQATGMNIDPNITRNMRGYYAFAWWRYDHSIHPMTTAVIVETGFVTNPADRKMLTATPEISAQALTDGIVEHLRNEGLMEKG